MAENEKLIHRRAIFLRVYELEGFCHGLSQALAVGQSPGPMTQQYFRTLVKGASEVLIGPGKDEIPDIEPNPSPSEKSRNLAAIANDVETKVKEYESSFKGNQDQMAVMKKQIEDLLVGATSVGLGIAFHESAEPYKTESRRWRIAVLTVLAVLLVVAGCVALYHVEKGTAFDLRELIRYIPLGLPLIWLILYLQRQAAIAQRLAEAYAFKSAVSKSFEGYKKQLIDLEREWAADAPINQYYREALRVIIDPPGRIYEKHRPEVSPWSAIAESLPAIAKSVAEVAKSCKPGNLLDRNDPGD